MEKKKSAVQRFLDSMVIDYEKWHDGIGYDLKAIDEMTETERREVARMLASREQGWREVEAMEYIGGGDNTVTDALRRNLTDPSPVVRLAAIESMARMGLIDNPDVKLAREIIKLKVIGEGECTRALLLAQQYPTDVVKKALLKAAWQRTECSVHCAAMLCYLTGHAKEPFDWEMRPFFLRLSKGAPEKDRIKAFKELCELVGMELEPLPDELKEKGVEDDWSFHE